MLEEAYRNLSANLRGSVITPGCDEYEVARRVYNGILRSDDALLAVKHGASGVIVSNHGARQLDTTPATISVLPEIADAVGGKVEVYVDGGIRRGTDVLCRFWPREALRCD